MRHLQNFAITILVFIALLVSMNSIAQTPTYTCVATNDTLLDGNNYQFDVYIYRTGTNDLYLNNYQLSFQIANSAVMLNGGVITGSYVAGSSLLLPGWTPAGVSVFATNPREFRINGPSLSSNGTLIPTTGIKIGTFRLTNSQPYGASNMGIIWWNTAPATTVVWAIVPPAASGPVVQVTTFSTHTTIFTDPVNVPVTAFNMTGGGSYCSGGSGVNVGLDGSQSGVLYRLVKNATPIGPNVPGTGSAFSFGLQDAGTYTSTAHRKATYLSASMNGSVNVTTSTAITAAVLSLTGSSCICSGSSSSFKVDITGGASPYTLVYFDGTNNITVNSYLSGSDITVSPTATKTYSLVSVADFNGCTGTGLTGSATVTVATYPVLAGLPAGGDLGCNPVTLPTCANVTASNECGPVAPVTCTPGSIVTSGCNRSQDFTYSATACGLTTTSVVTYTWQIVTTPVLANLPAGGNLGCNPTPPACNPAVTASNECGPVTVNCTPGNITVTGCGRSQDFTYSATACSLTASAVVSYSWTVDTDNPVFSGCPAGPISLGLNPAVLPDCADAVALVSVSDACSGIMTPSCSPGTVVVTGCLSSQTFTLSATDACGNTGTCSVTYNWTADAIPPTITCAPNGARCTNPPTYTSYQIVGTEFDPTVSDNCNGTVTVTHNYGAGGSTLAGVVLPIGQTVVIWTAQDAAGNTSTCNDTIWVGAPISTIETATNACDGQEVDVNITEQAFQNVGAISLALTYDPSRLTYIGYTKNAALWSNFVVNVPLPATGVLDTIYASGYSGASGPGLYLSDGSVLMTLRFTYHGCATGTDLKWIKTGAFASELSPYSPQFAQAFCDTPKDSYYKDGTVSGDNSGPTVTAGTIGSCYTTVALAEAAALAATTASDNCPGTLTKSAGTVGDCSAVITVTVTDGCGYSNFVTYNTRIDATPPTVTAGTIGTCYPTVALAESAALAATTETDNCPGTLTESAGTVGDCSAVITVTVTDGCGNSNFVTYNTRIDGTPPSLTCPSNAVIDGDCSTGQYVASGTEFDLVSTSDNCSGPVTITGWSLSDSRTGNTSTLDGVVFYPGTTTVTWYAEDGCGNVGTCSFTVTINNAVGFTFGGNLYYYNITSNIPMSGVSIELKQGGVTKYGPVTTSGAGAYSLTGVCPGTYDVMANFGNMPVGNINSTDAAQVNHWSAIPFGIEKVRFYAGDVAGSGLTSPINNYLTPYDAQRIQGYFITGGTLSFVRPPWSYWLAGDLIVNNPSPVYTLQYPTVSISGNLSQNLYALCTGDFNRGFAPGLKDEPVNLDLVYGETILRKSNTEFDLPIRVVNATKVSAISMILNFPPDLMEVTGVSMNNADGQLDWAVDGNKLRIGWNTLSAIELTDGQDIVVLHLKTSDKFVQGQIIQLSLPSDPLNEMADENYNVIPGEVIRTEVVESATTGIPDQSATESLTFNNYPNPFTQLTTMTYYLPYEGKVIIQVNDLLGKVVKTVVNETQAKGDHSLKMSAVTLNPGIYMATLKLVSSKGDLVKTIKLIVN